MTSDLSPNMTCDGKDTSNQSSPHTSFATDKLRQVVCLAEDLMIGYSRVSFPSHAIFGDRSEVANNMALYLLYRAIDSHCYTLLQKNSLLNILLLNNFSSKLHSPA